MRRRAAKRREYDAAGPLIARSSLQFSGQIVERRAVVPETYFTSARKRRRLWDTRKVDHAKDLPAKALHVPPAPTALPAVTVQPDTFVDGGKFSVPPNYAETLDAQRVAFKATRGETVHVTPPPKPFKRR